MTASQLKNAILQYAVQGKLVPQNPNDEPASVLLEKIRKERKTLIKAGKIKSEKPFLPIADEEIPFEIPKSWEWVRLGEICTYIQRGKSPKYSLIKKYPVIAQKCNQWEGLDIEKALFIDPESLASYNNERILQTGDLLWNSTGLGTLGRMALYNTKINQFELAVADSHVTVIRPLQKFIISSFLYYYFANPTVQLKIENQAEGSTKQKELSTNTVICYLTPLPPLSEQKRIVERIEELLSLVNEYDKAEQTLTTLDNEFPEKLKKSVLQSAIHGKLIPQDSNDEPAGVLLERIRTEKKKLIKEGKIKPNKEESIIFRRDNSHYEKHGKTERCIDDEIPFEIPESWVWVRLREIVYNHGQITPNEDFCYIDIGSIENTNQKLNNNEVIIHANIAPSRARKIVKKGDILYATVRPYLHNMCIVDRDFSKTPIASTGFAVMTCYKALFNRYLFYHLLSPDFDIYANNLENSKGVAYPAINDTKLYNAIIPLPPFEEQKRIVDKIEKLLSNIPNN